MREPEDIPRRTVPQATAHTSKAKITTIQAVRTTVPQTATQPTVRARPATRATATVRPTTAVQAIQAVEASRPEIAEEDTAGEEAVVAVAVTADNLYDSPFQDGEFIN